MGLEKIQKLLLKTNEYPIERLQPKLDLSSVTQYEAMSNILHLVSTLISLSHCVMGIGTEC